jgi:uncharacterized membrane protein
MTSGSGSQSAATAAGPAPSPIPVTSSGLEPHIAGALCYTPFAIGLIASVIFLVAAPFNQNKFIRFNAFQSLFMHLAFFVASIAVGIVAAIITAIMHFFGFIIVFLYPLLWLAILGTSLFMMYKAFNNQMVKLPFIGDLAEKQA